MANQRYSMTVLKRAIDEVATRDYLTKGEPTSTNNGITNPFVVVKPLNNLAYFWRATAVLPGMRPSRTRVTRCAESDTGKPMTQIIPIDTILHDRPAIVGNLWLEPCPEFDSLAVQRYRRALIEGRAVPPVIVAQVANTRIMLDGRHRTRAHLDLGRSEITAVLFEAPSYQAAVQVALGALARPCAPLASFTSSAPNGEEVEHLPHRDRLAGIFEDLQDGLAERMGRLSQAPRLLC